MPPSSSPSKPHFSSTRCRYPHIIVTPRLMLRSPRATSTSTSTSDISSEAAAIADLLSKPANNPFSEFEEDLSADVVLQRMKKWQGATERGESAFMVVILRDNSTSSQGDGKIIGFGGFNAFKTPRMLQEEKQREKQGQGESNHDATTKVEYDEQQTSANPNDQHIIGDIGILIDHQYWRKGYALEATCATIEFAFTDIDCEEIMIDTGYENEPLRALLKTMGLETSVYERVVDTMPGQEHTEGKGGGHRIWTYRFGKNLWQKTKEEIITKGRWPLSVD